MEGWRGLQRGLFPAYFYQLTMNGARVGGYEYLQRFFTKLIHDDTPNAKYVFVNALSGALGGVAGAAIGSPFFCTTGCLYSILKY